MFLGLTDSNSEANGLASGDPKGGGSLGGALPSRAALRQFFIQRGNGGWNWGRNRTRR